MMWLLGAMGFVRKALGAALTFIREKPSLAAIIALCAVCGLLWMDGSRVRQERDAAIGQVVKWKGAQAAATAWAMAEKRAKETAANDITKGANDARNQAASLRAGNDYAARNVCLRVTPAKGGGERADLSGANSVAGQPAPEADNALVAVNRADFDAATVNSADLLNAYQWGQAMIAAGLLAK